MKVALLMLGVACIASAGGFGAGRYTAHPGFILMRDGSSIEGTELHGVTIFIPAGTSGVRIHNNLITAGTTIDERPRALGAN